MRSPRNLCSVPEQCLLDWPANEAYTGLAAPLRALGFRDTTGRGPPSRLGAPAVRTNLSVDDSPKDVIQQSRVSHPCKALSTRLTLIENMTGLEFEGRAQAFV